MNNNPVQNDIKHENSKFSSLWISKILFLQKFILIMVKGQAGYQIENILTSPLND